MFEALKEKMNLKSLRFRTVKEFEDWYRAKYKTPDFRLNPNVSGWQTLDHSWSINTFRKKIKLTGFSKPNSQEPDYFIWIAVKLEEYKYYYNNTLV